MKKCKWCGGNIKYDEEFDLEVCEKCGEVYD